MTACGCESRVWPLLASALLMVGCLLSCGGSEADGAAMSSDLDSVAEPDGASDGVVSDVDSADSTEADSTEADEGTSDEGGDAPPDLDDSTPDQAEDLEDFTDFEPDTDVSDLAETTGDPDSEDASDARDVRDSADTTDATDPPEPADPLFEHVQVVPDMVFLGQETVVVFTARLVVADLPDSPEVVLVQVDEGGAVISEVGQLFDDGDPEHGDAVIGDGVFSLQLTTTAGEVGFDRYRVQVEVDGETRSSAALGLVRLESLTVEQVEAIIESQAAAMALYDETEAAEGAEAALTAVIASLEDNPLVASWEQAPDQPQLALIYEPGLVAILSFMGPDLRAGSGIGRTAAPAADGPESDHRIGTRKALFISPEMGGDFFGVDETFEIAHLFNDAECPPYDVTVLADSQVTLETFKALHEYGFISIVAHGEIASHWLFVDLTTRLANRLGMQPADLWDILNPLLWTWLEEFDTVVMIQSGVPLTLSAFLAYQHDFVSGRLVVSNGTIAISPGYIATYSEDFPDSLVYVGACFSTHSQMLARAFLDKGASTFLGFDQPVASQFAEQVAPALFTRFVDNVPEMIGEVFTPGQFDPYHAPPLSAEFQMIGAGDLRRPDPSLRNGGFEEGTFEHWDRSQSGVNEVLTSFGSIESTEGDYAALFTTFDPPELTWNWLYGFHTQAFCIPPTATSLEMDYNLLTQHCGARLDAEFKVVVSPAEAFLITTKELCDGLTLVEGLPFERPFDVHTTGWSEISYDLSELVHEEEYVPTFIYVGVKDLESGQFRDTAVMVDDVRILTE